MKATLTSVSGAATRVSMRGVGSSAIVRHRTSFVCVRCQYRDVLQKHDINAARRGGITWQGTRRDFSWTARRRQDDMKKVGSELKTAASSSAGSQRIQSGQSTTTTGTIQASQHDQLPSHREQIRWRISKYVNEVMDDLMPKIALASQRINTYTGTDYSGIEALRKEILEQEKLVKSHHAALVTAKESLETARSSESLSRKEVVSLLERRHSWSDTDLERYMSLIRSEHLNDQAVQTAKDRVTEAEADLASARNKLEKMERMQYHEEQIWSDTIRRNSTWVTFGLMGVNILLLLVTMGVVEPWRRKRMVREIKAALEENRMAPVLAAAPFVAEAPIIQKAVEEEVDQVIEPKGVSIEAVEEPIATTTDITPEPVTTTTDSEDRLAADASLKEKVADLFSDRVVTVRKLDMSNMALEGAAAGAVIATIILALLRPH